MRPRPDAAENHHVDPPGAGQIPASMRPRPDAAENQAGRELTAADGQVASMRPRPDAAENLGARYAQAP